MPSLAAKVACSVVLALILKQSDQLRLDRIGLLRANYGFAAILAFGLLLLRPSKSPATATYWVALLAGVSYVASLVFWLAAISQSGIALSTALTRVSIIVPVGFSILLWHEAPRWYQAFGALLGLAAALLIGRHGAKPLAGDWGLGTSTESPAPSPTLHPPIPDSRPLIPALRLSPRLALILLFIASAAANLSSKLFSEVCPAEDNLVFQVMLFLVAFIVTTALYYARKDRVTQAVVGWGALLGGVNLGSSVFLILALSSVTGTVAFPISAAAEVAVVAVLGRAIWKERIDRLSALGLGLAVMALVLVNL